MKTTFKFIGAAVLGAAVLFGAESCKNNTTEQPAEAVAAENSTCAQAGGIVYIDITRVLSEYQMAVDLSSELQTKIEDLTKTLESNQKKAEAEIKRKQNNLQSKFNDFQDKVNKGHLTESAASVKYQELQKLENEYNTFLSQKDQELAQEQLALQNTYNEEMFVMNNIVNDAINTFIKKYNAQKGYAMILISQGDAPEDGATTLGNPVLTADPSLDITSDVIAGLNDEYNATK
ncbi:MAG: OmpH family outer membrane protein [Bacteroidales bacterium]|nr:OmpH family outer membrane protein [Bacteroidales bacterium]